MISILNCFVPEMHHDGPEIEYKGPKVHHLCPLIQLFGPKIQNT